MPQHPHGRHPNWHRGMAHDEPSMVERAGGNILFDRPPVLPSVRRVPDSFFRVANIPIVVAGGQSIPVPFKWPRGGTVLEMALSPVGVTTMDLYVQAMSALAVKVSIADARESITLNATPGSASDDFILFSSLVGIRGERVCYLERPVWDQLTWQVQISNAGVAGNFQADVMFTFESDPPGVRRTSYRRVCVAPGTEIEVLGNKPRMIRA